MRPSSRTQFAAAAAALLLGAVGCGSQDRSADPATSHTPSATPSTTLSATPSTASSWVELSDDPTGVRFSLPHHADPKAKPGLPAGVSARVYEDKIDDLGLAVSVVQAGVEFSSAYARSIYDQMVSGLNQQGAKDAKLSAVAPSNVPQGDALDATLTFTATDGTRSYWRMRTITNGRIAVQVQVIAFGDPGDSQTATNVDAVFDRLKDSIVLG